MRIFCFILYLLITKFNPSHDNQLFRIKLSLHRSLNASRKEKSKPKLLKMCACIFTFYECIFFNPSLLNTLYKHIINEVKVSNCILNT